MIECDARQVEPVNQLLNAVPDHRDEKWKQKFLSSVVYASFACGSPQVFIGPDGFSYFGLYTPKSNQPFNAYCICNLIGPLTEKGIGISINPHSAGVDWVFTAGDMLAYRLFNTFDAPGGSRGTEGWHEEVLPGAEQVLIAAPSELFLPSYTRRVLRRFIEERLGIKNPGVLLVSRASAPSQYLVFSIYPDQFADEAEFQSAYDALSWFLPRHYSLTAVPRDAEWARHFQAL